MFERRFLAKLLNAGVTIFLVNSRFVFPAALASSDSSSALLRFVAKLFSTGARAFSCAWHASVGAAVLYTMVLNAVLEPALDLTLPLLGALARARGAAGVVSQHTLDARFARPPFDLSASASSVLMTVCICFAYAPSAPALLPTAALALVLKHAADKVVLLRCSQQPPRFDARIATAAAKCVRYRRSSDSREGRARMVRRLW